MLPCSFFFFFLGMRFFQGQTGDALDQSSESSDLKSTKALFHFLKTKAKEKRRKQAGSEDWLRPKLKNMPTNTFFKAH